MLQRGFFVSCRVPAQSIFHRAIPGFINKLNALPNPVPGMEGYPAHYLQRIREHAIYYLQIYADMLQNATQKLSSATDFGLLDVGSGNGLLGIFAKYCNVKNVVLLDSDNRFVEASKTLATHLHIPVSHFITGEISELFKLNELPKIDVVAGSDMIEHVYDLSKFLRMLAQLNPSLTVVFSTAANAENPVTRRKMNRIQVKDEYFGDDDPYAEDEGKTIEPYIRLREKIISGYFPGLDEDTLNMLTTATRGMCKEDILNAVNHYMKTNEKPIPAPGNNTCHPYTGSWSERLYSLKEYRSRFAENGFEIDFFNGFYNQWEPGIKGVVKKMLNRIITIAGFKFSPYFIIRGNKK